jgi:cell division protein FtsW (lipid II flippase)
MRARNRELLGLVPAALLVTAGFAAVFIQESGKLSNVSLIYGAVFLGLCLAGHIFIRITLPHADPYIFPLVAVLACFGLVMVYRIAGATEARQQAQWFVLGLVLFAATVLIFRDYRKLESYRYLIVIASIIFMALPRVPGLEAATQTQTYGAYLEIHFGSLTFQPTEFAKLGLVIFLASYLRDHRQALAEGRRILGYRVPPLKHLGPVLLLWGVAMLILVFLRDIGSSLMFYGGLLSIIYVATQRVSFVVIGLVAFAAGAWYLGTHIPHIDARVQAWLHPFQSSLYYAQSGSSYQIANGLFSQAAGGLFGQGFGQALLSIPGTNPPASYIPLPDTDMIYAVITDELGLFGSAALLLIYLLLVARGFKAAILARDSFSKLMATGLAAIMAIQVFVIVGGVTRVIPFTGVTLPFVSYGGSSIMANFILVALLLLVSDRARRPAPA